MLNAILIDKKPHCPTCGQRNYKIAEYKEIEHNKSKYVQFITRCKCDQVFKYCARISVNNEEYFIFDDEKEIKEIKNKGEED